jgi:cell division protein FtsX
MAGLIGALGALLMGIAGSVAKRVLLSLGIGFITFVGLSAAMDSMKSQVLAAWGAMPASVIQYLSLAGVGIALGIVLGALATRVSMVSLSKLGKVS